MSKVSEFLTENPVQYLATVSLDEMCIRDRDMSELWDKT